jgi:hypothetical protein
MNAFLAEMYGTRESIGAPRDSSDVEKLAEIQLLDEALRAEGVDIDKLDGGTIVKVAAEIFGKDSALVKEAAGEAPDFEGVAHEKSESAAKEKKEEEKEPEKGEEEALKEAALAELKALDTANSGEESFEEKVAQADYLGRQMAHAFWNEKCKIEKQASAKSGGGGSSPVKEAASKPGKKSAIDILAEKRAAAWAEEHGLLRSSDEEKLAAAVDQRAAEMLANAGIDVAAVEAKRAG